ncbi:MAG TPA: sigma 54-interacting transcriptional regulator, partial [Planctomycetota bacterium]|nr:sigma 54-interacting transcriptional regulator [Planctomycetota bacterium]
IQSNRGEYAEAEATCRAALADVEAARTGGEDREVRLAEMVLLGTLAHLKLRCFCYEEALDLFLQSLDVGERLGAIPEKSLILNNLGTLHVQESRFREAIGCYEKAVRLSAALADDASLAVLESNLAVLHARIGEPASADDALRMAARHDARCDSRRIRYLRLRSVGMVHLIVGRHEQGIDALEAAIALGEELKDHHLVAFDLVHLAECHLHRGELRAARSALDRVEGLKPLSTSPVASMAAARRALMNALRGDPHGFRAARAVLSELPEHGVRYVRAWNQLFLGWSLRCLGRPDEAVVELDESLRYFEQASVPAGEVHASLELAAAEAQSGRAEEAQQRVEGLRARFEPRLGALANLMLSAKLLLSLARVHLDARTPGLEDASALVAEAEGCMIGRRLRDLEALARDLKRRITLAGGVSRPAPPGDGGGHPPCRATAILGHSSAVRKVQSLVRQLAPSLLPVLITGETGVGKELVARAIHGESPRRAGPFVSINCAAVPGELFEAEVFGYLRGAFTGAEADHPGLLLGAHGGTFLFDEVGEMPLDLQAKLLRFLDRGRVRPIGGVEEIATDVRLVFATNRGLAALAEEGHFRRDLLYRLAAFEVFVPPLRERVEDIPLLVEHFRAQALGGGPAVVFEDGALRALAAHNWPGNVRELRNAVFRLALTCGARVTSEDVGRHLGEEPRMGLFAPGVLRSRPIEELLREMERQHLLLLQADHAGDLKAMASVLGITVRALYNRYRRLGLKPG